jgi:hypothetical protein
MIFWTNLSGTGNRPSPKYAPAGIATEGEPDPDGTRGDIDGMANAEPDSDGSADVVLEEKIGNQDTALVDGRDPKPATAPTNKEQSSNYHCYHTLTPKLPHTKCVKTTITSTSMIN